MTTINCPKPSKEKAEKKKQVVKLLRARQQNAPPPHNPDARDFTCKILKPCQPTEALQVFSRSGTLPCQRHYFRVRFRGVILTLGSRRSSVLGQRPYLANVAYDRKVASDRLLAVYTDTTRYFCIFVTI
jgi:hypothetical protein